MFTDTQIETAVRTALESDHHIKDPDLIAVSVDEIGTVVLRGAVRTLPERLAAIHDARHVEGVFEVIADDLRVHPPLGEVRADDQIRAAALQRLVSDSRIRSVYIDVKVVRGRVTLSGHVRDEAESAAAADDVKSLDGVIEVINKLEIR